MRAHTPQHTTHLDTHTLHPLLPWIFISLRTSALKPAHPSQPHSSQCVYGPLPPASSQYSTYTHTHTHTLNITTYQMFFAPPWDLASHWEEEELTVRRLQKDIQEVSACEGPLHECDNDRSSVPPLLLFSAPPPLLDRPPTHSVSSESGEHGGPHPVSFTVDQPREAFLSRLSISLSLCLSFSLSLRQCR